MDPNPIKITEDGTLENSPAKNIASNRVDSRISQTENVSQETPPTEPNHLKQIRTFEGDVAEAIKNQNESLISIQRAEEKKREAMGVFTPGSSRDESHATNWRPLFFSIFTIIFIVGGGYGAYYAWNTYSEKTAPPPINTPINQFIGATNVVNVDASVLGRQATIDFVRDARAIDRGATSLEQIELKRGGEPASELLATADFLTRLDSHAPKPLVRSFNPLFMFGILGSNPAHTILLIKLDSFENAFPGMLDWEPRMVEDILPLFAEEEALSKVPTSSTFSDKTIQNHDARFLKNSDGQTVLIYGFFDNSMLIITDEENTFRTVLNRLQSEKLSR